MSVRAIVFDFDGTIVESVNTKTQAFRTLFAAHPDHLERIVKLHIELGGRPRYEKFAMIYRDILHQEPRPGEFDELGRRFEALVADHVAICPFVAGAARFLDEFSSRLPLVIISGTPHDELIRILARRNLQTCFVEAHGSPPGKEVILAQLLQRRGWPPSDVLFVGDAMSDWQAATAVGTQFVARVPSGETSVFPDATRTIADLCALPGLLQSVQTEASVGGDGERR